MVLLDNAALEQLNGLFNNPGDNTDSDIVFCINVRHYKGNMVFLSDCPVIVAGMGDGIDTDGKTYKDGSFMNIFHSAGIFALHLAFLHIFDTSISPPHFSHPLGR